MLDETRQNSATEGEFIAFSVQGEDYCIDIKSVREIRRWSNATRLPHAPEYIIGVINLRGAVVPVIDFSAKLKKGVTVPTDRHSIIIIEWDDQTCGLLVDSVSDILTADEDVMRPTPNMTSDANAQIVTTLIIVEERMLRVVNVAEVARFAEAAQEENADLA